MSLDTLRRQASALPTQQACDTLVRAHSAATAAERTIIRAWIQSIGTRGYTSGPIAAKALAKLR